MMERKHTRHVNRTHSLGMLRDHMHYSYENGLWGVTFTDQFLHEYTLYTKDILDLRESV